VEDEGVDIGAKLRDQERHLVSHKAADEVNITAQTVELRDGHVTPEFPCGGQGGLKLRTTVQSVRAFAGLYLHELAGDYEALGLCEVGEGLSLGRDAETRAALLGCRYANVRD
jgi:hypothetical protein